MANAEKITEIIDQSALDQWNKFIGTLDSAQAGMAKVANEAVNINKAVKGATTINTFSKEMERAAAVQEKLRLAAARAANEEEKLVGIRAKNEDARKRYSAAESRRQAQAEAQAKREQQRVNRLNSAYAQMDAQLTKVRTRAQDVAAQMFNMEQRGLTNEKAYTKLQRRLENLTRITNLYDTQIKKIDASLGKSQRNVGNYASGWDGLGNSINQLAREGPAFAVSFQTGILALSNNIPILIDEINRLRVANAALAAQGEKTVPVWRQVIKSLFGWQVAISLAVTLVTIFAKDIGEAAKRMNLFGGSIDSATASKEAFNEALKGDEFKEAISNVIQLRNAMNLYRDGLVKSTDVTKLYNDTIGSTAEEAKNLADVENFLAEDSHNYIQMTLNKAAANLQLAKAAETAARIQEESIKGTSEFANIWDDFVATVKSGDILRYFSGQTVSMNAEYYRLLQQAGQERKKALITDLAEERDIYISNAEKLLAEAAKYAKASDIPLFGKEKDTKTKKTKKTVDDELKLELFRQQALADNARRIAEDDKASFDDRVDAYDAYMKYAENAIEIEKKMALQVAENEAQKTLAAEEAVQALVGLTEEGRQIALATLLDQMSKEDKIRTNAWADRQLKLEQQGQEELHALDALYINKEITEKEYQKRRADLQVRYSQLYVQNEIGALEELIQINKQRGIDVAEQERELARLKMKYSDDAVKKQISDAQKAAEVEKEMAKLKKELAMEIFNLGESLFSRGVELRLQELDQEEEALETREERERRAIESSSANEEEKQRRIRALELRTEQERKVIEQRRRAEQRKQAIFDKAAAMVKAAINTAVAITAVLPNIPLAVIIGALGAVQVGAIAAQPIPQYFRGTNSSKEGLAHVGERGRELVIYPSGDVAMTPATDTLTYLPKGSQVLTASETKAMMGIGASRKERPFVDVSKLAKKQSETTNEIRKLGRINRGTILTKSGLISVHKSGSKWANYLKRNKLR